MIWNSVSTAVRVEMAFANSLAVWVMPRLLTLNLHPPGAGAVGDAALGDVHHLASASAGGLAKEGQPSAPKKWWPRSRKLSQVGLTDREAGLLAGIRHDTMTEWRKDPEFSGAIKRATAQRLLMRLERIEAGEQGWQGTAWALERLYPQRFARPEVMNQIAVVNQGDKVSTERVIVLPGEEFDALIGRPGYHLCENGDLERREGSLVYVIVRQQSKRVLPMGE